MVVVERNLILTSKEGNLEVHMIMILMVLYCLVVVVVEEPGMPQVDQVGLGVEPFCFMHRRLSSMVLSRLMVIMVALALKYQSGMMSK